MGHSDIHAYSSFVNQLNSYLSSYSSVSKKEWKDEAIDFLDGLAGNELRRLVPLETRRKYGAFFTPTVLAKGILEDIFLNLNEASIIYDPSCGAGDLLLSTWEYLIKNNITPKAESFLLGTDIHSEFVDAARIRLKIKKLILESDTKKINTSKNDVFKIRNQDGLIRNEFYDKATHIFVNPPFNLVSVHNGIDWSSGTVSAAALFLDHIVHSVKPGTEIVAILPDVLRCGSRYNKWRRMILNNCSVENIKLLGLFDNHTDIDVFAISLLKKLEFSLPNNTSFNLYPDKEHLSTIKDKFLICVGPVVDNRDKHSGKKRGFIVSRGLLGNRIQTQYSKSRKYSGKAFNGPFLVVKRTSRMGDNQRAVATIVSTKNPVYVDNHLIVLVPKSGKLDDCFLAMQSLKDPRTDEWLNNKIRCRHLTVKIVGDIPIW